MKHIVTLFFDLNRFLLDALSVQCEPKNDKVDKVCAPPDYASGLPLLY